jgi:hypothetical protein
MANRFSPYAIVTVGVLTGVDLSRVEDKGYR